MSNNFITVDFLVFVAWINTQNITTFLILLYCEENPGYGGGGGGYGGGGYGGGGGGYGGGGGGYGGGGGGYGGGGDNNDLRPGVYNK